MADIVDLSYYSEIKSILEEARAKVYSTANSAMVMAYWNIGKILSEVCGESDRAAYGKQVMKTLSEKSRTAWRIELDTIQITPEN